jgi:hypothetical protein
VSLLLRVVAPLAALALVTTTGACAGDEPAVPGTSTLGERAPQDADPEGADPEGADPEPDPAPDPAPAGTACEEVVAGIEAFNRGELDETVASFGRALPLAEAEDDEAGTQRSADLLEAVRYYAALPAEDYPEASLTSPDFARYQAITLGQCGSGEPQGPGGPGAPDDDSVPA